jgi:phytoene dehydrogenase-like protein
MHRSRAVVIGSGAGGLAAAAYLARDGFDVVTVEQSSQVGGLLAPFERGGYRFDPGLHYIGQCRPGQMVHALLADLGLDAGALFCELDPDGFDVYRFPEFEVKMCRGLDAYQGRLSALFPEDSAGLGEVFDIARSLGALSSLVATIGRHAVHASDLWPLRELPALLRFSRASLGELLDHYLTDPRSIAALSAPCGDWALPPSRSSALGALQILAHYGDGAFFPRGGSGGLRDALVTAATSSGARFRTGADVARILVKDGAARGVRLADGETLEAEVVVSDVDPTLTFGHLIPPEDLPARLRRKVARTVPSLAPCALFVGLRRDLREYGLGRYNLWSYPTIDIESLYAPLFAGELPPRLPLFLSSASIKDPEGGLAPSGCSALEVIVFVPSALFGRWEERPPGQRDAAYHATKQRVTDLLLEQVEERLPGLVRDVAVCELSTPLTYHDYTRAVHGGAYGPAMTPEQWGLSRFGPTTPFHGLFLAGAAVLGGGVAPALLSGKLAADAALRRSHATPAAGERASPDLHAARA